MRKTFIFAIIFSLAIPSAQAQKRKAQTRQKRQAEQIDYPAEIEKNIKALNLDEASELIEKWEKALISAKKDVPDRLDDLRQRVLSIQNQLERVEKIEIIDVLHVPADDFFSHYMLSSHAGELLDGYNLPEEYASHEPTMVYRPQNGKELFWSKNTSKGHREIVTSRVLDDGTIEEPKSIGNEINGEGNADYPFMMDDGSTIYFAADGENSIGGYDIFMTRRSADGDVLQPQNIGMPYNSPYNDYMMVIDDARSLGWWASDREQIPGQVTIYVFKPSTTRVNYSSDDDNLASYALLSNVKAKGNLDDYLLDKVSGGDAAQEQEFVLSMGNGKVYTHLSDFRHANAARSMEDVLDRTSELEDMEELLLKLRLRYAKGDHKVAQDIKKLEQKIETTESNIAQLTNKVIKLENK